MKKILFIIMIVSCLGGFAFSLTLPEDYIKDGIGVRPYGMGGAYTAVSGDLHSVFYNPAGLDSISTFNYRYGSNDSSKELTNSNNYSIFNLGSLCFTNIVREDKTGQKVESDHYSFGERGSFGLSYGLTYKNIRWNTSGSSGQGYGADLGVISRITPDLSLGPDHRLRSGTLSSAPG